MSSPGGARATGAACGQTLTMTKTRIGLFGTGPWARQTQGPALAGHPGVELAGVWGRRGEAAAELAAGLGTSAYVGEDGVDALIEASDAVAVALPPDVQAPLAARAAAAGRHLLLDKPLAANDEDARRVTDAAEGAGVHSVVFFTARFDPATARWIAEQAARGDWFAAQGRWFGSLFGDVADSPFAASPWRRERGGLWDVGPHALSVVLPVLGEVTDLAAVRSEPDLTHLVLRHASGASSALALSLSAPRAGAGTVLELGGRHGVERLPDRGATAVAAFEAAIDALLEAVRTGRPHDCDARFGAQVTAVLAKAERTAATLA